ncbi:MAG: hypothetical protein HQ481_16215 [Alphaproteobacteria bacterium]|nr:hypothetical protein [Alphaproteobacteria bacterium]
MALRPTGPGDRETVRPSVPARGRTTPPAGRPEGAVPAATPEPARTPPTRGRRLPAATTDADIERQIQRLMTLIANDNIDPDAPPGSYLNLII